jgi:hypothetical protein
MSMAGRIRILVGCLLLLLAFGPTAAQAAGSGVAAWHISQSSQPTNFVPGSNGPDGPTWAGGVAPLYYASITNAGGETAHGESEAITIVDTLPAGVGFGAKDPEVRLALASQDQHACERSAAGVVPATVTCTVEREIKPGETIDVAIPVAVGTEEGASLLNQVEVFGGGGKPEISFLPSTISNQLPSFSFLPAPQGLEAFAHDEDGLDSTIAGSHPFSLTLSANITSIETGGLSYPTEAPKRLVLELPKGLVVNPEAPTRHCTERQLIQQNEGPGFGCPPASQVGWVNILSSIVGMTELASPLYAMEPPPGVPAEFAFNLEGVDVHVMGGVAGDRILTATTPDIVNRASVLGLEATLWGNPGDSRHNSQRLGAGCPNGCSIFAETEKEEEEGKVDERNKVAFLTMPTSCGEQSALEGSFESWEESITSSGTPFSESAGGPRAISGCNALSFEPTIESKATTNVGDAPSGLSFSIHQPQNESLTGRAAAALKNAQVMLPEGLTVNPAAANGLSACSEEEMGYEPVEGKIRFQATPQTCPDAAKVGTLEAKTPLLADEVSTGVRVPHILPGSVYLAKPFANPFDSLLALYLAIEDEDGIVVKLAGKVEPDPTTGKLTATFTENPELPLEDIKLHFFEGTRAALTSPITCGTHTTTSTLTPWSTPEGVDVHPSDSFATTAGCFASEAAAPKNVSFTAGTQTPLSGAYSPFVLRLSRKDGTQHIAGIDTTLPAGLVGKLAGVAYCPESGIAQAIAREHPEQGKLEQQSPSCPSSSEVGTVNVTAGSGIAPIPVSGHAYLAGPYKGAPLSMVAIVPAVAGPFDLGTVVDRVALNVGEYDARIHAVADPLPTIREGIPLDVRSIELKLDRPSFTLNPTSCEAMAIAGSVSTQAGQTQPLNNRFQVGECGRLAFKPKLQISLKGQTRRTGHPALKAVVTYPKGGAYANIARAQVSLPHSEFLDQGNIGKACTKVLLAQRACPAKSIYGKVKAWTPLLEKPLEGPVYLVGGYGYKLPALVAELNGQIRVLLVGKVDTGKNKGIRNTFEAAPDAPVERFVLEMKGGKKYGLLENSENICRKKQVAGAAFTAQNGKVLNLSTKIVNSCKGKSKGKKKPAKKHRPA